MNTHRKRNLYYKTDRNRGPEGPAPQITPAHAGIGVNVEKPVENLPFCGIIDSVLAKMVQDSCDFDSVKGEQNGHQMEYPCI